MPGSDFDRGMAVNASTGDIVVRILDRERRRKWLIRFGKGILRLLTVALLLFLFLLGVEIFLQPDPGPRTALVLLAGGVVFVLLAIEVFLPAVRYLLRQPPFTDTEIAREYGQAFPDVHDRLLNVLQLKANLENNPEGYSRDLILHAIRQVEKILAQHPTNGLYSAEPLRKSGRQLLTPLLILIFGLGIFPQQFREGIKHLLHPTVQYKPVPVQAIEVRPGNTTLLEGDSCQVEIRLRGTYRGPIRLFYQEEHRKARVERELRPDTDGTYRYLFAGLRKSIRYFVKALEKVSPVYTLQVEKRPFVRLLKLQLVFPAHTGIAPRYQEDNVGDVTAIVGTRVLVRVVPSKPVQQGWIVFSEGRKKPLQMYPDALRGEFTVRREVSYHIELVDTRGYRSEHPIAYRVTPIPDQPPLVEVVSPGKDVDLTEEMKLPLAIEAEDDFGFSGLRLGYRIQPAVQIPGAVVDTNYHYVALPLKEPSVTKLRVEYLWDLSNLGLMPEDVVFYFAEVLDNDAVTGPKRALSRIYTARFPSVYEIYEEVTSAQKGKVEELEEALEESKELKKKLEEISRELLQQEKVDWLKKQDLEELGERQRQLQQQIEEIKRDIEEMVEKLESNQLLSFETLKKFEELQRLFQEIMTPELAKALEELRKAFEQLDERKLKNALNQLQLAQDKIQKSLERTINLLRRLELEQKLDMARRLAENLAERQRQVAEQLKKARPEDLASLMHMEQRIREDAQDLDRLLETLEQRLRAEAQFQSPLLDSLRQEMDAVLRAMDETQMGIQQSQPQRAAQTAQVSEQQLRQMIQQLRNLKRQFVSQQKQEIAREFRKASESLLQLSKSQETLWRRTRGLPGNSPQVSQIAEGQHELLRQLGAVTKDLYGLSQKTFFVTPEIGRALGKSIAAMQRAIRELEERRTGTASQQQRRAMGGLNETIMQIQASMQSLQGASSAVGFEEFLKRLEQMAGKQQGINQQTLQLGLQGKMTLEQQAAMARLAAEQEALRKSLEQLRKEFGNRSEIAGRLEGIAKEMEKVVEDLQRKKVNPRTIERQRRILSRLLDAQRSLHQRDYSRQRQSRPGKTYFVRSPEEIRPEILQKKDRFLEDLMRARKAGFQEDYLNLIRAYFEAISREKRTGHQP